MSVATWQDIPFQQQTILLKINDNFIVDQSRVVTLAQSLGRVPELPKPQKVHSYITKNSYEFVTLAHLLHFMAD